jgi:AcrR family transcriptional regulator
VDGQRLTRKGQATRDRIVATAARLMFERGVASTSIENVQHAAGVSASQLYHYFGDKKNLVRAVIAYSTEAFLQGEQPMVGPRDSVEALRAWRDAIVELQRRRGCVGGCVLGSLGSELADTDEDARADVAAGFARSEAALRGGLRAMAERGELRDDADPERLAVALLAALQGGLLLTQIRRDTVALEAALDTVIDHIEASCR